MVSELSHGLEPMVLVWVLMLALLIMEKDQTMAVFMEVLTMVITVMALMVLPPAFMEVNMVTAMALTVLPLLTTVPEPGVHNLSEVLTMVNGLDKDMDLALLITLISVTMASDTLELMVIINQLFLLEIKAMEHTAHGEPLPTLVPGQEIGLVPKPTVLLMVLRLVSVTTVSGTLLLMLGLVLSILQLLTVLMTGPLLVLLLLILLLLPDGPEIIKQQNLLYGKLKRKN
jgi:hypothetical protein